MLLLLIRTLPPGIEYILHTAQEPHLYVIKKQFRHGPDSITAQAYYYVHTGTIYQVTQMGNQRTLHMFLARFLLSLMFFSSLKPPLKPFPFKTDMSSLV